MTGHALAVAATVSVLAGLAPQQPPWTTYTSVEGRYSVSLPQQPQLKTEELTSGGTTFLQYTAQISASGAVYMAVWSDPPIPDTATDKADFIEGARAALIRTINGTQLTAVPSVFGEQGREFTIRVPHDSGERFVRVRTFFIGRRSYTLVMMTMASADRTDAETRFFESFRITSR